VDFTGCLAHAEVTYLRTTQKIIRVRGYFNHNEGCKTAVITRFPAVPLHPAVYEIALQQLKDGATLTDIQEQNRAMVQSVSYSNQPADLKQSPYRWHLRGKDTRSLYRQFNRMQGIKVTEQAHLNIDEWLDPESPQFNQTLRDAVFHYSPRATRGERFEVCIATPDMSEGAWKYSHKSQIILDGTFGVCDKKILLFIVMGVDEQGKGVPLAFFLFSAPSGNRHTAAGYNTEVIAHLLEEWKKSLGKQDGKAFEAWVAITDTDLMERGALLIVFPRIWLLICKFHIRQSWRNHRNKELKGDSPLHIDVKNRLRRVEERLIHTTSLHEARAIIGDEAEVLEEVKQQGHTAVAEKGLKHLNHYLLGYWCTESLWCSWSDYGRQVAAKILNCPLEGVLPTTNHLESFNGVLKRKHLRRWQRGGRRLRIDVLVKLLITKIFPSIFEQRLAERNDTSIWESQMGSIPGGEALLKQKHSTLSAPINPTIAYLCPDESRDEAAAQLLGNNQIEIPSLDALGLVFICHSSFALDFEKNPVSYNVRLGFDQSASCECLDFVKRGGACKHIHAALLRLSDLRSHGLNLPDIQLPSSADDARILQARRFSDILASGQIASAIAAPMQTPMERAAAAVEDELCESDDAYAVDPENPQQIHTGDSRAEEDSESDNESVATDAPDDDERDAFDFTSLLERTSKAAFNEQTVARVFYELEGAAPKLGELGAYLKHCMSLPQPQDFERALAAQQNLASLHGELNRLITDYIEQHDTQNPAPGPSQPAPPTSNPPPSPAPTLPTQLPGSQRRGRKRTVLDIIGASPEKASKRKQSYKPF